jgi:hypothetical protein
MFPRSFSVRLPVAVNQQREHGSLQDTGQHDSTRLLMGDIASTCHVQLVGGDFLMYRLIKTIPD